LLLARPTPQLQINKQGVHLSHGYGEKAFL
jgi:hypothetical protein